MQLDLNQLYEFQLGTVQSALYRLTSMVCYYGQHYMAMVWRPVAGGGGSGGAWVLFDDASVSKVRGGGGQ